MKKESGNIWVSWMALGLSVVAIGISAYTIKLNPITLSEPSLNWMIGIPNEKAISIYNFLSDFQQVE